MSIPCPVTAAARIVAVLVVLAGVLAMHVLTTGHHGDVPLTSGHATAVGAAAPMVTHQDSPARPPLGRPAHLPAGLGATSGVASDTVRWVAPCSRGCLQQEPGGAPHLPGHLLDLCLAILLAAATVLLLPAPTGRRVSPWLATGARAFGAPPRLRQPSAPCRFRLGVLRT